MPSVSKSWQGNLVTKTTKMMMVRAATMKETKRVAGKMPMTTRVSWMERNSSARTKRSTRMSAETH
jgi:hypothetical protein